MQNIRSQNGSVLFVSLMILIILTVLGLGSMQNSIMQEKMTAAVRDGQVALEGAEAAIHHAEAYIESLNQTTGFTSTATVNNGCLYAESQGPDQIKGVWEAGLWASNSTKTCVAPVNVRSGADGSDGSLAISPRYYIELAGLLTNEDATNIMMFNYNNSAGSGKIIGFRIVISSVGSSETSRRYISTYYGKRI